MTGSLKFYSKDEAADFNNDIANDDNNVKSFKYKTTLIGDTAFNVILENETIAELLKYLSNFWWLLEMPLINCEVKLTLKWAKHCLLATDSLDNTDFGLNKIIFTTKDTKSYVSVVTLLAKKIIENY